MPGTTIRELVEAAHFERATLTVMSRSERAWLFDLVALSDAVLLDDPDYDRDLAPWTDGDPWRDDGVPASSFGTMSETGSPPMRNFAHADPDIPVARQHYPADPCVAILSTSHDTPMAWLNAGQALQRVLLLATLRGLSASFLNQPLETADIRQRAVPVRAPANDLAVGLRAAAARNPAAFGYRDHA